jgi:hypothetical protein
MRPRRSDKHSWDGKPHAPPRRHSNKKDPVAGVFIILTGSRRDDHFRIDVGDDAVFLPCASFSTLIDLIYARITSESGFIHVPRGTIHRLRKAIDECVGPGAGKQLIETGCVQEYRLTIAKAKIAERVGVTHCFFELVDLHVVTTEEAETLRKTCSLCILRETEVLPWRD